MNILKQTADGSYTLYNPEIGEHYHSAHGALQESKHVFLQAGITDTHLSKQQSSYNILEMGFGTGLNFLLTADYANTSSIQVNYTGIEAFPLKKNQLLETAYNTYFDADLWNIYIKNYDSSIHSVNKAGVFKPGALLKPLNDQVTLEIWEAKLESLSFKPHYDIIYFDAFSVRHQPELWTNEIISKICEALLPGGTFVSYAITGNLKRVLKAAGLETEKLPGPPGKREMIRAHKPILNY